MKYRSLRRYKYQLIETYEHAVPKLWGFEAESDFLTLIEGSLLIHQGYAWDGPSGPTIDTENFMRGSLVHDALYQLMREGHISNRFREYADGLLRSICIEDGMSCVRAWWVWKAVRWFGAGNARRDQN